MTDMSVWYAEVAEIGARANAWCNFAIVCGCIGLALSIAAAILLIKKSKVENGTIKQKMKEENTWKK